MIQTQTQPAPKAPAEPAMRYIEHFMPTQTVGICPSCRSVVLWASANQEGDEWKIDHGEIAVLAIEIQVGRLYSRARREGQPYPAEYATHNEMFERGWTFERTETRRRALIFSDACGIIMPVEDDLGDVENLAFEIVPCPWPRAEDKSRFSPIKLRLADAAIKKASERYDARGGDRA